MSAQTAQSQRNRSHRQDVGKVISVSFGFHELNLIEDLDLLANYECVNRSQWIRRKIRDEKRKFKEQVEDLAGSGITWQSLVGDK